MRGGFQATTPLRTIVDLAASPLAEDQFAKALRDALRSGLVRRKHLLAEGLPSEARERITGALAATEEEGTDA